MIARLPGVEKKAAARPLIDPCAVDWGAMRNILSETGGWSGAYFDRRVGALAELVDFPNMRDWRLPFAKGRPVPRQSFAKCARGTEVDNEVI